MSVPSSILANTRRATSLPALTVMKHEKRIMMSVRQGVDVEKLEAFRGFLTENPDKGQLGLEVKAVYEGQAGRSTVHVGKYELDGETIDRDTRHYTFPFGAWREVEELLGVEGPTDRMEPVEMALAATAACVVNALTYNSTRLGIDTEGVEVTIRENVDPRVLFALREPSDHASCLGGLDIEIKVRGEISDDELATLSDLASYSPVYGLIAESVPVKHQVSRA